MRVGCRSLRCAGQGAASNKSQAFLKRRSNSSVFPFFSGKLLAVSETDGSSFPNGGLRETHEARGYTSTCCWGGGGLLGCGRARMPPVCLPAARAPPVPVLLPHFLSCVNVGRDRGLCVLVGGRPGLCCFPVWDTTSTPFITTNGQYGNTVNIPSTFFSWKGHSLDFKVPLLRSERALTEQGVRLLKALGQRGHKYLRSDCGAEQVRVGWLCLCGLCACLVSPERKGKERKG